MKHKITLSITLIIGVFLVGFGAGYSFIQSKWDKANLDYQQKLQDTENMYKQQLEDLTSYRDSVETKIISLNTKINDLNSTIANRNKALDSLKTEYDETIDDITSMSNHELINFFSNRY